MGGPFFLLWNIFVNGWGGGCVVRGFSFSRLFLHVRGLFLLIAKKLWGPLLAGYPLSPYKKYLHVSMHACGCNHINKFDIKCKQIICLNVNYIL